jgi:hypothetical protein
MLTLGEYAIGKVWTDTESPIIFLKPRLLLTEGCAQELSRIVYEMSRGIIKKNVPRLFLLLDLRDAAGSDPVLTADYIRYQLRLRTARLPIALTIVRSADDQLMHTVELEIAKFRGAKASIHLSFEEALRRITDLMKADLVRKESLLGWMSAGIRQLF